MEFQNLFKLDYWMGGMQRPLEVLGTDTYAYWGFAVLFCFLSLAGLAMLVRTFFMDADNPLSKTFNRIGSVVLAVGLLGYFWLFARTVEAGFISARFWLLFGFIFLIGYGIWEYRKFNNFFKMELEYYHSQNK